MTLGKKLQQLRKNRGMSQERLAEELGVSRQAVSKWELDAALPDTANIVALSRIFGVSTDYLLKDDIESESGDAIAQAVADGTQRQEEPYRLVKNWQKFRAVSGVVLMCTGLLALLVMFVVAQFVPVMIPYTYQDEFGEIWHTYDSTHTGISLKYFVEQYELGSVIWMCVIIAVIGIILMLWDRYISVFLKKVNAWFDVTET